MRLRLGIASLATVFALPLLSDEKPGPYAGHEKREIKALSPEEIEGYRTGAGMGFAKAAELNHYPGPKHLLELAQQIGLDSAQREKAQRTYDAMHAETVGLGARLLVAERDLDALFANGKIDEASLARSVREIARLQGEIRLEHLKAHLAMRSILKPEQVARYDALRGYGTGPAGHDPSRHGH